MAPTWNRWHNTRYDFFFKKQLKIKDFLFCSLHIWGWRELFVQPFPHVLQFLQVLGGREPSQWTHRNQTFPLRIALCESKASDSTVKYQTIGSWKAFN
jgi:hypothetical protein